MWRESWRILYEISTMGACQIWTPTGHSASHSHLFSAVGCGCSAILSLSDAPTFPNLANVDTFWLLWTRGIVLPRCRCFGLALCTQSPCGIATLWFFIQLDGDVHDRNRRYVK